MANTGYQNKRKFHTVYQTTNMINNKIYIGAHSTDDLDDDYYGSGTNITRAIKKYGKEYFKKDILFVFETSEEMLIKEKEIVTSKFLKRLDVYNIVEGGYGGYNKGSTGLKHLYRLDTNERCAVHPNAVGKMIQDGWILGFLKTWHKEKIYVHKAGKKKVINPQDLKTFIDDGWIQGLPSSPTSGKIWIYFPMTGEYSLCDVDVLESKLEQGWIKKKWAPIEKGKSCWITNGLENKRISLDQLDGWIQLGWTRGITQAHKS